MSSTTILKQIQGAGTWLNAFYSTEFDVSIRTKSAEEIYDLLRDKWKVFRSLHGPEMERLSLSRGYDLNQWREVRQQVIFV